MKEGEELWKGVKRGRMAKEEKVKEKRNNKKKWRRSLKKKKT